MPADAAGRSTLTGGDEAAHAASALPRVERSTRSSTPCRTSASATWANEAGGMAIVNHHECVVAVGDLGSPRSATKPSTRTRRGHDQARWPGRSSLRVLRDLAVEVGEAGLVAVAARTHAVDVADHDRLGAEQGLEDGTVGVEAGGERDRRRKSSPLQGAVGVEGAEHGPRPSSTTVLTHRLRW